jgi:hypothetical protein
MSMTTAMIVNLALGLTAFTAILGLAAWAIRTGDRDAPGRFATASVRAASPADQAAQRGFERSASARAAG